MPSLQESRGCPLTVDIISDAITAATQNISEDDPAKFLHAAIAISVRKALADGADFWEKWWFWLIIAVVFLGSSLALLDAIKDIAYRSFLDDLMMDKEQHPEVKAFLRIEKAKTFKERQKDREKRQKAQRAEQGQMDRLERGVNLGSFRVLSRDQTVTAASAASTDDSCPPYSS